MGFFDKLKESLSKTRENLTSKLEELINGSAKIDEEFLDELEETLILSDVGMPTTDRLMAAVRKGIRKREINAPEDLKPFLQREITSILTKDVPSEKWAMYLTKTYVILVVGVNGAGKTTTIGKLSAHYRDQGYSVMLAAADTFRAAAIDQLEIWAERTGATLIKHDEGSDPSSVALDATRASKSRAVDVLIVDTAGRLQNKFNLMEELKKINRVLGKGIHGAPHEVLLVLDSTTGQNAISQAELFTKAAPVTGLVLTKLDGTAKGED